MGGGRLSLGYWRQRCLSDAFTPGGRASMMSHATAHIGRVVTVAYRIRTTPYWAQSNLAVVEFGRWQQERLRDTASHYSGISLANATGRSTPAPSALGSELTLVLQGA